MAQISIEIDDKLKKEAKAILDKYGISLEEFIKATLITLVMKNI